MTGVLKLARELVLLKHQPLRRTPTTAEADAKVEKLVGLLEFDACLEALQIHHKRDTFSLFKQILLHCLFLFMFSFQSSTVILFLFFH